MVIAIVILSVLLLFTLLQWFRSDIAGRILFLYLKDKNIYLNEEEREEYAKKAWKDFFHAEWNKFMHLTKI